MSKRTVSILLLMTLLLNVTSKAADDQPFLQPKLSADVPHDNTNIKEETQVLFVDSFNQSVLRPEWTLDAFQGNTITVKEGMLEIVAIQNTYAHIECPLKNDLVRVSAKVKTDQDEKWVSSLIVYWDVENWCSLGILPTGKFLIRQVVCGVYDELRLGSVDPESWHTLSIELGKDIIRFLESPDGEKWSNIYSAYRLTDKLIQSPVLLIIGKGMTLPRSYPLADMNNNDLATGVLKSTSFFDDIKIEHTATERFYFTNEDEQNNRNKNGEDILGMAELSAPGDPTFESVSRYFPPMQRFREIIGIKGHADNINVEVGGQLRVYEPAKEGKEARTAWGYFMVGDPAVQFGADGKVVKQLKEGYMPIVTTTKKYDDLNYNQTVFAYSEGMQRDTDMFVYIRMQIMNTSDQNKSTKLAFKLDPSKVDTQEWQLEIPGGQEKSVWLKSEFKWDASTFSEIQEKEYNTRLAGVTDYWQDLLSQGMKISVPEKRVNDAYSAWLAYSFLNVETENGIYSPEDGIGFYPKVYGYSAARFCNTLDLMGYHDLSRSYMEDLLKFVDADGLYVQNFGLPDHGALLYAMGKHYQMTGDTKWLKSVAPMIVKMSQWVIDKRNESKAQQSHDDPWYGLIFGTPYCDRQAPAYSYFTDFWLAVGIEEAATVLQEIGLTDQASRIQAEAMSYRADIMRSLRKSVLENDGMKMLPIFPQTMDLLKAVSYSSCDYYGIVVGPVLESGFLRPESEEAGLYINMLEKKGGLLLGMCRFQWPYSDGIDHAYTYGYLLNCLQLDKIEKVILGFYGFLAYGMTHDTYAGVELTNLRTGINADSLPHLYSCTQQLRLLRDMLFREDENNLLIAQAVPRHWLDDGGVVEVKDAVTSFGKMSYEIKSQIKEKQITATLILPAKFSSYLIKFRLRNPQEKCIRKLLIKGKESCSYIGEDIILRKPSGKIVIKAYY